MPRKAARLQVGACGVYGTDLFDRIRARYPFADLQTGFPFTEDGIREAIDTAGHGLRQSHDRAQREQR